MNKAFFSCSLNEKDVMDRANPSRPVHRLFVICLLISTASAQLIVDEAQAVQFLNELDPNYLRAGNAQMKARWQYITDVTPEHSLAQVTNTSLIIANWRLKSRGTKYLYYWNNNVGGSLSICSDCNLWTKLTMPLTGCALSLLPCTPIF